MSHDVRTVPSSQEHAAPAVPRAPWRFRVRQLIKRVFRMKWLYGLFNGYVPFKPITIGIEPTNDCNLDCVMCARNFWDDKLNKVGDMALELFYKRIAPHINRRAVNLQAFGEPFMAKGFMEMLTECKRRKAVVSFTNNGTYLKKYARQVVEVGPEVIEISMDGTEMYESVRGVPLKVLRDAILEVNRYKRELKRKLPVIHLHCVAMKSNIQDLPDLVRLAKELEVEYVHVSHIVVHSWDLLDESLFRHPELVEQYFPQTAALARELKVKFSLPSMKEEVKFCSRPFKHLYVNWNGDVKPCCYAILFEDSNKDLTMGNLYKSTIDELWNSPKWRALRQAHLTGKNLPPFCEGCIERNYTRDAHIRMLTADRSKTRAFTEGEPSVKFVKRWNQVTKANVADETRHTEDVPVEPT